MAAQGSGPVGRWDRAGGLQGTMRAEKSRGACGHVECRGKGRREGGRKKSLTELGDKIRECHTEKLKHWT